MSAQPVDHPDALAYEITVVIDQQLDVPGGTVQPDDRQPVVMAQGGQCDRFDVGRVGFARLASLKRGPVPPPPLGAAPGGAAHPEQVTTPRAGAAKKRANSAGGLLVGQGRGVRISLAAHQGSRLSPPPRQ